MFGRLLRAEGQSRAAKTVEMFGWLILIESPAIVLAPHFVASHLHLPPLAKRATNCFRLVVGGLGMLYVVSGRLTEGFVFPRSSIDHSCLRRWLALWYFGIVPGPLALAFSIQDFGSFLWTLVTWRADSRGA